jgi:ectoine hydroxylase-related dioxygenase (phytanoyl-CoA dioxygenase family)
MRGAIPAAWIEPLRAAFDQGELANDLWPVPRGTGWRHAQVDLDPTVQRVCRLPALLGVVGSALRTPFFLTQVEGREPRPGVGAQGLHRDGNGQGPTQMVSAQIVSALAFLDSYGPHNGATQVAPATHRGEGLASQAGRPHADAFVIEGQAGDILVLDVDVLHGATDNIAGARRRSLLITYAVEALRADFDATRVLRGVRMPTGERFEP